MTRHLSTRDRPRLIAEGQALIGTPTTERSAPMCDVTESEILAEMRSMGASREQAIASCRARGIMRSRRIAEQAARFRGR
jgi:hypothetical protein